MEQFPDLTELITTTQEEVDNMNYFLGLNIADTPMNILMSGFKTGAILMIIGALAIPVLAALTQWLNTKLMTATNNQNGNKPAQDDNMANTMNTMNNVMPIMSAVFCLTLPVGMGIYWIAGAVVRSIQQVVINKKIDKMDLDDIVKKNLEKVNKKREKQGLPPQKMTNNAKINTRNIDVAVNTNNTIKKNSKADMQKKAGNIPESSKTASNLKPGSLAAKAMMVKEYNEMHNKK